MLNATLSYLMDSQTASYDWYAELIKPEWAPPSAVFGPVWSFLYLLIAISFGFVLVQYLQGRLKAREALPFGLNLIFNAAFTPLQFGLKSNLLAALDILAVLLTLIWAILVIWPKIRWVALIQIPYLLWVSFATVLQLTITYLNGV